MLQRRVRLWGVRVWVRIRGAGARRGRGQDRRSPRPPGRLKVPAAQLGFYLLQDARSALRFFRRAHCRNIVADGTFTLPVSVPSKHPPRSLHSFQSLMAQQRLRRYSITPPTPHQEVRP